MCLHLEDESPGSVDVDLVHEEGRGTGRGSTTLHQQTQENMLLQERERERMNMCREDGGERRATVCREVEEIRSESFSKSSLVYHSHNEEKCPSSLFSIDRVCLIWRIP